MPLPRTIEIVDEQRAREIAREEINAARDSGDDWIDQRHSPLGRKLHCAEWRAGVLPGRKVHRRVLVRRRDLDTYVETHGLPSPAHVANDSGAEAIAFAKSRSGLRRVGT
jgi:hypothetical protein